jgi:hypothetical protein
MKEDSGIRMLNSYKDEDTVILRNFLNYLPKGTTSQPGIPEPSSAEPL